MPDTDAPDSPARNRLGPVQAGSLKLYGSKYGSIIPRPPFDAEMRALLATANQLADMTAPKLDPGSAGVVEFLRQKMVDFHDANMVLDVIEALVEMGNSGSASA